MRIISLECRKCGAPLQIKEEMEQLACAHCGAQMSVERGGGAISLQLIEALGSIRTGTVQTAAELALVRLAEELNRCSSRIHRLEAEEKNHESNFNSGHLLSKSALDSVEARAAAIRTEIAGKNSASGTFLAVGFSASILGGLVGCNVASGFNSFLAFVGVPIIGIMLTGMCNAFFIHPSLRTEDMAKKLEGEIHLHQTALEHQTKLSEIRPQLVEPKIRS